MKIRYYALLITLAITFLSSCVNNFHNHLHQEKYDGKYLFYKQRLKGNDSYSYYTLEEYFRQRPNRKFIFNWWMPYWRANIIGNKFYRPITSKRKREELVIKRSEELSKIQNDTAKYSGNESKIKKLERKYIRTSNRYQKLITRKDSVISNGNWLMATVGEKPVMVKKALIDATVDQLTLFYQSNGYFNAEIEATYDTIADKKIAITYNINEKTPYRFRRKFYDISDSAIAQIIQKNRQLSKIKTGNKYSTRAISAERERLNILLKSNGYYDFQRQFIQFEIDTTLGRKKADVTLVVNNPKEGAHKQYIIKDIWLIMNKDQEPLTDTTIINPNKKIVHYDENFSKRILNKNIKFDVGEKYSFTKAKQTQQLLGNFDIFKFININFQKTHADSNSLTAFINTNSYKKHQITSEAGVNVSQNIGPFANLTYRSRKVFKGFEIFESSFNYSIQNQFTFDNTVLSTISTFQGNAALIFPQLLFPRKLIFPQKFRQSIINSRPKTQLKFSLGVENFDNIYERRKYQLQYSYYGVKDHHRLTFIPFNFGMLETPFLSSIFKELLKTRPDQQSRFRSSIVSSMQLNWVYNDNDITKNTKAKYIKFELESGGTFLTLWKTLNPTKDPKSQTSIERVNRGTESSEFIPYFQFLRVGLDFRIYRPLSRESTIAARMNMGLALPFGGHRNLPVEKLYYAGGPSSIRAWVWGGIGPGGYGGDVLENGQSIPIPGEIILESNLEFRTRIISFIHGAVFFDAGNVWNLEFEERANAQFSKNFYQQIAVASGLGLRLDFSFLILRFDYAFKFWDPSKTDTMSKLAILTPFHANSGLLNLGIGYPF